MPAAKWSGVRLVGLALTAVAWLAIQAQPVAAEFVPAELAPGTIAVVDQVEGDPGTITTKELARGMAQAFAFSRKAVPRPGQPRYAKAANEAFGDLLEEADIEGEAAERKLIAPGIEVSRRLAKVKRENFDSEAGYRNFLHRSKMTNKEAREKVRLQLLIDLITIDVLRGISGEHARRRAFAQFVREYSARWRERTVCAPRFANHRCSNEPEAGGA